MRQLARSSARLSRWTRNAVGLVASLALLGALAAPALATTPAGGLGMNGWYLFWVMPQSKWDAQLATMAAGGVRTVRADALWQAVEPIAPTASGHRYVWTQTDAIAAALARHGLRWLPIIDYSASWAESVRGDLQSPPTSVGGYAAYAAAVVARYGPGGSFWLANPALTPEPVSAVEIWNEPNVPGFWGGKTNAAQYAKLYQAARAAMHAADPSVEAIVGGLANPADTFLNAMYSTLGGAGQIDAVADHPYDRTPQSVMSDVWKLRRALDVHGDVNVPIDMTEFGWPTGGSASWIPTLSDSARAAETTQVIDTLAKSDCGVERILPYSWMTAQSNPRSIGDWFGIVNANGAATQTSAAVAREYAALAAMAPSAPATIPACGRPLTLNLAPVAPQSSSYNLCVQATVLSWSSAGWASVGIGGAAVSFTVKGSPAPAPVTLTTDSTGHATACFGLSTSTSATVTASAQHPSFYLVPTSNLTATSGALAATAPS